MGDTPAAGINAQPSPQDAIDAVNVLLTALSDQYPIGLRAAKTLAVRVLKETGRL